MLLSLKGKKVKASIIKTVTFSLSLSEVVHLKDFGEDNSDFTTVPCAQMVFVMQHVSPFKS